MNNKNYIVKIYRDGVFKGALPYVVDDVEYTEEINTSGTEITIKMGADLSAAGITLDVDHLVTDTGDRIVDHFGNAIVTRKDYVFENVPVDLGNQVDIYLYYSGAPNGTRIFTGLISSWEADETEGTITMTALSYGVQLDNYLIEIVPNQAVASHIGWNQSQPFVYSEGKFPLGLTTRVGQTFQLNATTDVSSVKVAVTPSAALSTFFNPQCTLSIATGIPGANAPLSSVTRSIPNDTLELVEFTFDDPVTVVGSTTYCLTVTFDNGATDYTVEFGSDSTGGYSSGTAYTYNDGTEVWSSESYDLAFEIITATGSVGNEFLSVDPGVMLQRLIDNFNSLGGLVTYDDTIDITNTTVSYTFKYSTVLEGVKKVIQLAPANWYWYVDSGTNLIHFHRYDLHEDHIFIKGQHMEDMKPRYSLEEVKNKVILSGGDDGSGNNLVVTQSNTDSIHRYGGQWLSKDSDSRVSDEQTASTLVQNTLGEHSRPRFSAEVEVLADRYDIETLKVGDMVGFRNFNDLTNSLILQIVSRSYEPDRIRLMLSTLPPTQTHRIEDIRRNLDALQTANNPNQ
jgi:hypothetical protein